MSESQNCIKLQLKKVNTRNLEVSIIFGKIGQILFYDFLLRIRTLSHPLANNL